MKKEEFLQLSEKVRAGNATDAELDMYNRYFLQFQKLDRWDEITMGNEQERGQQLYEAIDQAISPEIPVRQLSRVWKIAAIAAMLILVAGLASLFRQTKVAALPEQMIAKSNKPASSTNDLIQLPDGSMVILSAGSKLEYAPSFEGRDTREVFLVGKAFFDIKHREDQPFIVHTGAVVTKVLGTAFDIDSRTQQVTVNVIRGKVVVSKGKRTLGTLTPNKQVVYDLVADEAVVKEINAEKTLSWKEKDLVFNDVSLEQAVSLLEERYHVQVTISDEKLAAQRFTTTLFENQSLAECLSLICDFNNAEYIYNTTKQITIKPKN